MFTLFHHQTRSRLPLSVLCACVMALSASAAPAQDEQKADLPLKKIVMFSDTTCSLPSKVSVLSTSPLIIAAT